MMSATSGFIGFIVENDVFEGWAGTVRASRLAVQANKTSRIVRCHAECRVQLFHKN